jgi:hypothetical protein
MTPDEEEQLYHELKTQPDFDCLPLPTTWFKRFNIPPRTATNTKDFIESDYTMRCASEPKDLPPLIIDEPQKEGQLVEVPHEEPVTLEVINRPFVWDEKKPFPAVLPFIKETAEREKED